MESTLVVKVKCGDTLRRFNASIGEGHKFELNMQQLKEKMRSLFKLNAHDDFTLTYTDSDGDSVTLVEDCDLDDVVLQRLNPVRMVLTLTSVASSRSYNERKSTPVDSPTIRQSIDNIQTSVENLVNTVPEPLRLVLLKLTRDLSATASAQVVSDIIHSASQIGESSASGGSLSFAKMAYAERKIEKKSKKKTADTGRETRSGLPGLKTNSDAEVKAKEVDSGVCHVPDLNQAPPQASGFAATVASPNTCGNNYGKRDTSCPMFANGGSLNEDAKPYNGCPFSLTLPDLRPHTSYKGDRSSQFKGSHSHSNNVGPVSHAGVRCDGCDVLPITGPRFKSKVRHNYDLCSSCYQISGNKADYVRIDSPILYHHIMKTLHRKHGGLGQRLQAYGKFKPVAEAYIPFIGSSVPLVNQVKLDSRFILDVNVVDGTMMAPSTPFTKIWRMKNNGNVVWPVGTQLVWTDGDVFSSALSVVLEIPATGVLPVEGEIDVAVDFVAPELPGEYVSYWRMSSASGQKFGQRVWVAIQVDASSESLSGSFNNLNLNVPSERNSHNSPVVIDINVEPPMNNTFSPSNLSPAEVPVTTSDLSSKVVDLQSTTDTPLAFEPLSEAVTGKGPMEEKDQNQEARGASSETKGSMIIEQDLNFPINDFLQVGDAFSNATAPPSAPSVSYPVVDSSKIEAGPMPVIASSNAEQAETFNETEESLLKQLSEMGFGQVDLSKEILRKNAYEMEKTVVDLWEISEWDPIMDELEEMGFSDKKRNAMLLVKNKGSIKRVVMDLVAGDKSQ